MPLARDWVDYANLGIAAFAAIGTFAAVLVALFGDRLRARRSRPLLTISSPELTRSFFVEGEREDGDAGLYVEIANAPGRDTARDVEVYVTMTHADALASNLNLGGVMDGTGGSATMQLPAGHRRRVYVCNLGTPEGLLHKRTPSGVTTRGARELLGPLAGITHAALSLWPARRDVMHWVADDAPMEVELIVTGANVPTERHRGTFVVTIEDVPDDRHPGLALVMAVATWTAPPRPVA